MFIEHYLCDGHDGKERWIRPSTPVVHLGTCIWKQLWSNSTETVLKVCIWPSWKMEKWDAYLASSQETLAGVGAL